ncbi:hypothetical protein MMC25_006691 [Agyrium rufum]|nr:hypothetical protein [Agyrium rufum]
MSGNPTTTTDSDGTFARLQAPASASSRPPPSTNPSSGSSLSRKRSVGGSGKPALAPPTEFQKLQTNYVGLAGEEDLPSLARDFLKKTDGAAIDVDGKLAEFRQQMSEFKTMDPLDNEPRVTKKLGPFLFQDRIGLRQAIQNDYVTHGMPQHPKAERFLLNVKNPRPDYTYGYAIETVVGRQATALLETRVLETCNGLACGSFVAELKCQAKGGTIHEGYAQVAGALAACLNSLRIVRTKMKAGGKDCPGLENLVLPGLVMDEFTAHLVLAWETQASVDGKYSILVAIVDQFGLKIGSGQRALLTRLEGIMAWLQGEHSKTVQEIFDWVKEGEEQST